MSSKDIKYTLRIDARTGKAEIAAVGKETGYLKTKLKEVGPAGKSGFAEVGKAVGAVMAGLLVFKKALDLSTEFKNIARDGVEIQSKFDAVFKELKGEANSWADDFATNAGRAKQDVRKWAATLQDTFVPLGFARRKAMELSQSLVTLAADVASFNNEADEDTIRNFTSALVGNHETVRRYGIIISEASLSAEALNMGLKKNYSQLTDLEKVQARYNILMKGTADAQGDVARTADSLANVEKRREAALKNLKEELGTHLIPMFKMFNTVIISLAKNADTILPIALGLLAGSLVIVGKGVVALAAQVGILGGAVTAATGGMNLLVAAAVAVGVGVAVASRNTEELTILVDRFGKLTAESLKKVQALSLAEMEAAKRRYEAEKAASKWMPMRLSQINAIIRALDSEIGKLKERQTIQKTWQASQSDYAQFSKEMLEQEIASLEEQNKQLTFNFNLWQKIQKLKLLLAKKNSEPAENYQDVEKYYNKVKFADADYYSWKKQQIRDEVREKKISADKKRIMEQQLLAKLEEELKAYYAKADKFEAKYRKSKSKGYNLDVREFKTGEEKKADATGKAVKTMNSDWTQYAQGVMGVVGSLADSINTFLTNIFDHNASILDEFSNLFDSFYKSIIQQLFVIMAKAIATYVILNALGLGGVGKGISFLDSIKDAAGVTSGGVDDAIVQDGKITPFRKDDLVVIGTNLLGGASKSEITPLNLSEGAGVINSGSDQNIEQKLDRLIQLTASGNFDRAIGNNKLKKAVVQSRLDLKPASNKDLVIAYKQGEKELNSIV